ncbi:hypothetical protein HK405_012140, partial [Cladochytrium tenue]
SRRSRRLRRPTCAARWSTPSTQATPRCSPTPSSARPSACSTTRQVLSPAPPWPYASRGHPRQPPAAPSAGRLRRRQHRAGPPGHNSSSSSRRNRARATSLTTTMTPAAGCA